MGLLGRTALRFCQGHSGTAWWKHWTHPPRIVKRTKRKSFFLTGEFRDIYIFYIYIYTSLYTNINLIAFSKFLNLRNGTASRHLHPPTKRSKKGYVITWYYIYFIMYIYIYICMVYIYILYYGHFFHRSPCFWLFFCFIRSCNWN